MGPLYTAYKKDMIFKNMKALIGLSFDTPIDISRAIEFCGTIISRSATCRTAFTKKCENLQ